MPNFSRDKNEGAYRSGEGGGGPAMCDPESESLPATPHLAGRPGSVSGYPRAWYSSVS